MPLESIKTRDGDLVYFDKSRIERAIEKAAEAIDHKDLSFVEEVSTKVVERLKQRANREERFIGIEEIQDVVEEELIDNVDLKNLKIHSKNILLKEWKQAIF